MYISTYLLFRHQYSRFITYTQTQTCAHVCFALVFLASNLNCFVCLSILFYALLRNISNIKIDHFPWVSGSLIVFQFNFTAFSQVFLIECVWTLNSALLSLRLLLHTFFRLVKLWGLDRKVRLWKLHFSDMQNWPSLCVAPVCSSLNF